MSNLLIKQLEDGVVHLILNRPKVHNALNQELILELIKTLEKLNQDESVRVVCLIGSGKYFCSGADLHWMQKSIGYSKAENIQDAKLLSDLLQMLYSFSKPTVAIIQGSAFGGALGLIACCDIAIAVDTAKFSFSEVRLGLVPAVISPYIIKAVGERQAKRYFLTTEIFDAKIAKKIGLIHEKVSEEKLPAKIEEIAHALLKNSSHAMKMTKQLFQPIILTHHQKMIEMLAEIRTSTEAQKRLVAFLKTKGK
jgi:methylglutaconyl-CoA hydratase